MSLDRLTPGSALLKFRNGCVSFQGTPKLVVVLLVSLLIHKKSGYPHLNEREASNTPSFGSLDHWVPKPGQAPRLFHQKLHLGSKSTHDKLAGGIGNEKWNDP